MKKILITVISLLIAVTSTSADEFIFQWDYPDDVSIDGFRLYSGPMGQDENGDWVPKYGDEPLIDNIDPVLRIIPAIEEGWINQSKKFCFMIRSFRGNYESDDSNFICAVIDNTALIAPVISSIDYSIDGEQVIVVWTCKDTERANFFKVYYRVNDDLSFTELGRIDKPETMPVELIESIDAVGPGETKTLHFVVVAFKNDDVFSPNSIEFPIVIDRSEGELPKPENFRFTVIVNIE